LLRLSVPGGREPRAALDSRAHRSAVPRRARAVANAAARDVFAAGCTGVLRRCARERPRGFDGEGARCAIRGGQSRRELAQDQACPHARSRRARCGVGHGRRTGKLSNLHLGALDPATGEYVMLGKTFKGLTDAMLEWQTQELLKRKRPVFPSSFVSPARAPTLAVFRQASTAAARRLD